MILPRRPSRGMCTCSTISVGARSPRRWTSLACSRALRLMACGDAVAVVVCCAVCTTVCFPSCVKVSPPSTPLLSPFGFLFPGLFHSHPHSSLPSLFPLLELSQCRILCLPLIDICGLYCGTPLSRSLASFSLSLLSLFPQLSLPPSLSLVHSSVMSTCTLVCF